jgi:hypothetical protein
MVVVAMDRIWLDVSFGDKDTAKAAGARWDAAERRWYAPQPGMPGLDRWTPLPDLLPGEDRAYGQGLFVDLIPQTSWFENVRSAVDPRDWDRLRSMVYRRAGYRCEACGTAGDRDRGLRLEAHERFTYDIPSGIQRLVRLVCLCHWCHTATHLGMAGLRGVRDEAIAHLITVTGMSPAQAGEHIDAAFARWERRSRVSWQVDLSLITAAGIRLHEAAQAPGDYEPETPGEPGPGILVITAITSLPPGPRPPSGPEPEPEPGPATHALAATYERYADELAAIEALRGRRRSA